MAQHLQAVRILVRHDRQFGVVLDQVRRIDQLAIYAPGQRRLGKAGSDRCRDVGDADRKVEGSLRAVGQLH